VLDSRYINHMTREKRILLRKMTQVIASHMETIAKAKFLTMLKLLSQLNILSLKFFLLNPWTIICCPCHNSVRWDTIVVHK
jgi:hypothetical protein